MRWGRCFLLLQAAGAAAFFLRQPRESLFHIGFVVNFFALAQADTRL